MSTKTSLGALFGVLATSAIALVGLPAPANALTVLAGSGTVETGDLTQTGRILRNGIASTWAAPKTNPGLAAVTGSRFYDIYFINFAPNASQDVFYEITWTNLNAASPHLVAYNSAGFVPSNPFTNYLGDAGTTPLAGASETFQVIVPANQTFFLVFAAIDPGPVTDSYQFTVNAFSDANRAENFPGFVTTPLPTTLPLFAGGLGALGLLGWRRKRKQAA
jgi:hypothetical protein